VSAPIGDDAVLAHAHLPWDAERSGLAGDIHFNATSAFAWSVGGGFPTIDFLEVVTHEIGHTVGVGLYADAIMQPYYDYRFSGPGTAYLLAPDILALRSLYGSGVGAVYPMPEPSTTLLVGTGLVAAFVRQANIAVRRSNHRRFSRVTCVCRRESSPSLGQLAWNHLVGMGTTGVNNVRSSPL
jgi:hypothetical protein